MTYLEVINKVIEDMREAKLDNNAQQTVYLAVISIQLTAIADELARMNANNEVKPSYMPNMDKEGNE